MLSLVGGEKQIGFKAEISPVAVLCRSLVLLSSPSGHGSPVIASYLYHYANLPGPVNSPPKADPNRHLRPDETATLLPEALSLGRGRSAADG